MTEGANVKLPIEVREILTILPHRYPMVMVDRVTELVPGERIAGHKCVAYNEPWFQGHFPAHPIMPGVLIVESMVQLGGLLAHASDPAPAEQPKVVLFLGIDKARFRRPVVPGDRLDLSATALQRRGPVWKLRGEARVDGNLCAEAEMLAQVADASR
ncbi:3-hydroxyacyl-ACP dehydratase FabZ [Polyangium sp. y55x31]|uniref:3-hydroxyacyl-ACP dehydratase FabZ n=1 Tax=Polyangium sp. y55x31 TaxID=3042688 RepID=UPI002482EE4C|nr:3-hydroxyacyl-ACP dehydratase FabZ [Polyangium sp. y55x31]MDI1481164.1 3-hydroxyacyl-ACP dehydratase FabZ [Polyangium sp. y55x31]